MTMHRVAIAVVLAAAVAAGGTARSQQATDIVRDVRAAIGDGDLAASERLVEQYRSEHGVTPELLAAMSWIGRGALAAGQLDRATQWAVDTHELVLPALETSSLEADANLATALGAAIEVDALARAERGDRSSAVYFLKRELEKYRNSPIHKRLQKNIHVLSLEGQLAPALAPGETLGRPTPGFDELEGRVVLLFFWAHWCPDCKAQAPVVARLLQEYGAQGLTVVAPTQLYGYVAGRRTAPPEEERAYIEEVRDEFYGFLKNEAAPITEINHLRYGVSSTPTLALVDREGIVRLYHPGQMPEAELEEAIRALL